MTDSLFVGLDVDGVVADMEGYLAKSIPNFENFSTDEEMREAVDKILAKPETWTNLNPLPLAKHAIQRLSAAKVKFCFISSTHDDAGLLRSWWLDRHFGKYFPEADSYASDYWLRHLNTPLYLAKAAEKPVVAKTLGVTHFADDRADIVLGMLRRGIQAMVITQEYTVNSFVLEVLRGV